MACRQQTAAANAASQPAPVTATLSLRTRTRQSDNTHRPPSESTYSCDNARNSSTLLSDRPAKTLHDPLSDVHDAAHTTGGQVATEPGAGHGKPTLSVSLSASSPPLPTFTVTTTGLARNFSRKLAVQSRPITLTQSSPATDETSASRPPLLSSAVSSRPSVIDDSPLPSSLSSNSSLELPSKNTESSTPHRLFSAQRSQTPVVCPVSLLHSSSSESPFVAKVGPALLFSDNNNSNNNNNNKKEAEEKKKKKKKQIHQQPLLYNPSRVPSHSPPSIGTTSVLPELDLDLDLDLDRLYGEYFDRTVDTEQLVAMTTSTLQYTPPFQPPPPPPPPYSEPSAGGRFSSPDPGFPRSGVDGYSSPTTDSLHDGDSPRQFRNSQQSIMTQPTPQQSFSRKVSTKVRGFLGRAHRSRSPSSRNSTTTVATVSEDSHISSSPPVANDNKGNKDAPSVVAPVVAAVTTTVTAPVTTSVAEPVSSTATIEVSANAAVDDFVDAHTAMEVPVVMPMMDAVNDRLKSQESHQTLDGHIPIMNGCQPDSGVRSGRSSYISLDSPTLATESSGNPSNRNSFRSFVQEERPRSRSPESPVTPDDDYRFNNRMPDSKLKYHAAAESQTDYSRDEESTHDGVESQVVPVYLDERNESGNGMIPSLLIETASSPCRLHPDHPESFMAPRPAPRSPRNRPASMRSRSPSPAPIMSPLKSLLPESGRETPSFLTPRPAPTTPIPSPGCGPIKPLRSPTEAGPKLLRSNTMSSRSAGANPSRAPPSPNPRVWSHHPFSYIRPSTATNSISEVRSFRGVSSLNRVLPPPKRLKEHDEISIISLGPPNSPNQSHDIEHNFPPMPMPNYATSLRKSGSIRSASGRALEIAVPPPLDSRSLYDGRSMFDGRSLLDARSILDARSVKTASPTTIPDDFKSMTSPKYHPDDAPLSPTVYTPDIDMIETDLPPRTPPAESRTPPTEPEMVSTPPLAPIPAPALAPAQVAPPAPVAAVAPPPPEVKRHSTVSKGLRRAFSRRRSVNKRTTGQITGEIISRPSTSATAVTAVGVIPEDDLLDDNMSMRSRPMMNPLTPPPSSPTVSVSRWKSVRGRSSSSASSSSIPSSPPQAVLPPKFKLASVPETVKLTSEELAEIARMPGTIFIKTSMVREDADQDSPEEEDLIIEEHRMKPRKGMAGTGVAGSCRFCAKGPFPNMWVCMDACHFIMCRMCANEKVQAGEAELF
ncbi:hypothetical protein L873DRAFT_1667849 [Choiromyces venosus 120613-1]|uniref:Uncharacterized protein n=1 Tax=Choiromyces venosus 120613-1 TaxID=1336337 RepID=A0A3N4K050_9PEZI|nr:hypothetical protein L873DRAFT_1667849 [Choiromyces venosus 120613-1]